VTTWPITVTVGGAAGGGNVSCTPNPVPNGQSATCLPASNPGYRFVTFSGDCSGSACVLGNVTSARNVTATFVLVAAASAAPVPALGAAAIGIIALALCVVGGYARRIATGRTREHPSRER
jgi:Divergent InlB B-repeat domain